MCPIGLWWRHLQHPRSQWSWHTARSALAGDQWSAGSPWRWGREREDARWNELVAHEWASRTLAKEYGPWFQSATHWPTCGANTHSFPWAPSATLMLLLWATQARWSPLGEKETLCTHPPQSFCSSSTSPKGILDPQTVGPGFSSMSLM